MRLNRIVFAGFCCVNFLLVDCPEVLRSARHVNEGAAQTKYYVSSRPAGMEIKAEAMYLQGQYYAIDCKMIFPSRCWYIGSSCYCYFDVGGAHRSSVETEFKLIPKYGGKERVARFVSLPSRQHTTNDTNFCALLINSHMVKSVVVAPGQQAVSSQQPPPAPPAERTSPPLYRSQGVTVFAREDDLERDKWIYLNSVSRHIRENPQGIQNVMTELQNLMNRVADQTPGNSSEQWQHPSDLTRRIYQQGFGNLIPSIPLHEWQVNNKAYKRFAMMPNSFKRSQMF